MNAHLRRVFFFCFVRVEDKRRSGVFPGDIHGRAAAESKAKRKRGL